jgi:hypothetical protein
MSDKCFITGADHNFQDMVIWWANNIRKYDKETDIVVYDFGMSKEWIERICKSGLISKMIRFGPRKEGKPQCCWFKKPRAMRKAPYEYKCWIDVDCEVLANITEIFDYVDGTNMALTNDPCRTRERGDPNPKWFATGVNVVKGDPKILKIWDKWCLPGDHGINVQKYRGDQEVLHVLLSTGTLHESVVEMPMDYQWLRIQLARGEDNINKKIIHWTGPAGKAHIRNNLMYK